MTFLQFVLGSAVGLSLAVGQMLFKIAANRSHDVKGRSSYLDVIISLPMFSACLLYAGTVLGYTYLLQSMPLSRAYMFSMAGSALVPLIAFGVFGESMTLQYIFGAILVFIGVALSTTA